jgi:hypothetical protein
VIKAQLVGVSRVCVPWTCLQFSIVTKFLSQLQPVHYLKWLNRGLDAYNLCAALTGMFPSRHSLSQTANHSIMLINLPKLPADRISCGPQDCGCRQPSLRCVVLQCSLCGTN